MFELILLLFISALISWGITMLIVFYAPRLGLVQAPNYRSSHKKITPHGGGIAIVVSTVIFSVWLLWDDSDTYFIYWSAIGLALVVALKGLIDDIFQLSAVLRLVIQFLVCIALLATLFILPSKSLDVITTFPMWLSLLLVLFAGVWWLNLFNFMDGIDGLAASEAVFMLAGAVFLITIIHDDNPLEKTILIWMLCLIASIAGFLLLNWFPAKIFMGDTGSLFLAFVILFLALFTVSLRWMTYASWAILGAVFICDASVTLFRRVIWGERVTEAHRSHAYQCLAIHWESHAKVTLWIMVFNLCWLLPLAWFTLAYPAQMYLWMTLGYFPIVIAVWLIGGENRTAISKIP